MEHRTTVVTSSDDSVSNTIIEVVAEADGVEPTELPPLYDAVEPDALDMVFSSPKPSTTRTGIFQFPYAGFVVTVRSKDNTILVTLKRS